MYDHARVGEAAVIAGYDLRACGSTRYRGVDVDRVTPASEGSTRDIAQRRYRSSGSRPRRRVQRPRPSPRPALAGRRPVPCGAVGVVAWCRPGSNTSGQGNGCVPKLIMTGERRQIATEPSCMAASWLSESAFTTEPCCIRIVLVSLSARAAAAAAASFDAPAGPDTAAP